TWNCKYFKLDALFWGALHGGHLHDPKATRIEAYRRGMEAILRGAGPDSFILGCNHPMWPSLGLIHGSRSSMDVSRDWSTIRHIADETFHRNWQNDRLWFNDPDCILTYGKMTDDQFSYHAAAILASGGMILSGDNLAMVPEPRMRVLRTLLSTHPPAASFADAAMSIGRTNLDGADLITLFNPTEEAKSFEFDLPSGAALNDFWTGEPAVVERTPLGRATIGNLPPTSARVLISN
ncbi:alpha-galactosidase, partial [Candidatus Sumerlaeota bacterium]|nr:alpha-galactosidase [Candidatus Sumerlaeota bacterium]